jgi:tetratricopeptide (TPR) repeat protein
MRRLNVKLALWLLGITVFSVVGVHFLHGYQNNRNADFLKLQAETARKNDKIEDAINQYSQYLRHRDDREGYQALSQLVVEVAKKPESSNLQKIRAYNVLEEAIRRHDDLDDVRSSLVDFTMMVRRFTDTQEHIRILRENGKSNPSLEYKSAVCYFMSGEEDRARDKLCEMLGLDPITGQFSEQPPATAKEIDAYSLLARILRGKGDEARADAVMEQLVKWNPDSARAHLTRGRYLLGLSETVPGDTAESKKRKTELIAAGKEEFEKALQAAPNDVDAMLALATTSMMAGDFARAQQLLDRARKEHPDRQDVYVAQAELARAQGKIEEAGTQLEAGLEHAADTARILKQLIEVQFQLNDLKAVRGTIERMHKIDAIPREYIRYQEARVKLQDNKIIEATREFEQVRSAVERLSAEDA